VSKGGRAGEGERFLWYEEHEPTKEREASFLLIFFAFFCNVGSINKISENLRDP
jgi:hypothetical protein